MTPAIQPNRPLPQPNSLERMQAQARELEGVFLNTLMKEMFSSVDTEGTFGGGFAEETWRGIQAEQMAQAVADTGGIGLADSIMRDLISLQEAAQHNQNRPGEGYSK